MSLIILLLTMGVVGVGTWGLTDSIKNTDHQVNSAWGLVSTASNTVSDVKLARAETNCTMLNPCLCLQIQNILNLATTTFSELTQLSPTLVSVSRTLAGALSATL